MNDRRALIDPDRADGTEAGRPVEVRKAGGTFDRPMLVVDGTRITKATRAILPSWTGTGTW
jgi:hypothetical protein